MIPTDFSQLIGNPAVKIYLQNMIDRGTLANSLLFAGLDGIGKSRFAGVLAHKLVRQSHDEINSGEHPDIYHYHPEGKLGVHSIQSLRQFIDEVHLPPYKSKKKIFIIHEAEKMLSYSANALLKTFEEPPSYAVIILITSSPESLLPTVLSRCRPIYFQPVSESEIEHFLHAHSQIEDEHAKKIAILAQGSLALALNLVANKNRTRTFLLDVLSRTDLKTYKSMTAVVATLIEEFEVSKKQVEQEAKEYLYKMPLENLSAYQQQFLEKELEGRVATNQMRDACSLFNHILFWYRDLHLLMNGGDPQYLMNPDYFQILRQIVQKGCVIPMKQVQKAVDEARVALQRSMSLQICLESLFLKLDLIKT